MCHVLQPQQDTAIVLALSSKLYSTVNSCQLVLLLTACFMKISAGAYRLRPVHFPALGDAEIVYCVAVVWGIIDNWRNSKADCMDDILSRIASFARNVPPVQTASSAAKCPTRTDLIQAIVSPRISPDCLKERVNVQYTKAAVLCFSKDRPYQLEQFLISAKLFLSPDQSALKIFVLYSPGRLSHPVAYSSVFDPSSWRHDLPSNCVAKCLDVAPISNCFRCILFLVLANRQEVAILSPLMSPDALHLNWLFH